jgi:hypothetical protein
MSTVNDALNVLADRQGFFPQSWHDQARTVVEEQGSDEEKKLAALCASSVAPAKGPLGSIVESRGEVTHL